MTCLIPLRNPLSARSTASTLSAALRSTSFCISCISFRNRKWEEDHQQQHQDALCDPEGLDNPNCRLVVVYAHERCHHWQGLNNHHGASVEDKYPLYPAKHAMDLHVALEPLLLHGNVDVDVGEDGDPHEEDLNAKRVHKAREWVDSDDESCRVYQFQQSKDPKNYSVGANADLDDVIAML